MQAPSASSQTGALEAGPGATAISASVALEAGLLHQVQIDLPELSMVAASYDLAEAGDVAGLTRG